MYRRLVTTPGDISPNAVLEGYKNYRYAESWKVFKEWKGY